MSIKENKYQIIATLGPAVKNKIADLIHAGATGFRLNCSHLSLEELSRWLIELERAFQSTGNAMPVWLDLQGSKTRIGKLCKTMILERGQKLTFKNSYSQIGDEIPLPHDSIFKIIEKDNKILLDDGRIELIVLDMNNDGFQAEVINFGELSSFKGFVLQNNEPELKKVSLRDQSFIEQTRHWKFVGYAISFLQNSFELQLFKNIAGGRPVVAKIERKKAFLFLREIAEVADMLWLCRGDLGVDATVYNLHHYEKRYVNELVLMNKPSLIAGQVLENMVNKNYPSRSEIAHLGYLIENGFYGVVLSDETAIGKFPVLAVEFCKNYLDYMK